MEAMEKLKAGVRFSEVASQYSEDKARQGVRIKKKKKINDDSIDSRLTLHLALYNLV